MLMDTVRPGDVVMIKSSKGIGFSKLVDALIKQFPAQRRATQSAPERVRGDRPMLTLLVEFADEVSVFNVFRYITFRTGGALITSALLVFLFGPTIINFAARAAGQGPADPRRRAADAFQEGRHADHGRADDPVGDRRLVAAVGQPHQRLCLGGAAGDARLRRDRPL